MSDKGRMVNVEVSTENMDKLIESQIQVAMLSALSEDSETLVARVVKMAMTQKCQEDKHNHRYNRDETPTVFKCSLDMMVRDAARGIFKDWLTEHHTMVREAIESRLKKAPKKFLNDIADEVVKGLGENLEVKASLRVENRY